MHIKVIYSLNSTWFVMSNVSRPWLKQTLSYWLAVETTIVKDRIFIAVNSFLCIMYPWSNSVLSDQAFLLHSLKIDISFSTPTTPSTLAQYWLSRNTVICKLLIKHAEPPLAFQQHFKSADKQHAKCLTLSFINTRCLREQVLLTMRICIFKV